MIRLDDLDDAELCELHSGYRSVIEQAFSLVHFYAAATSKFRASPELQEMVLAIIYALVARKIVVVSIKPRIPDLCLNKKRATSQQVGCCVS